jgi:hypothetical protein
MIRFIELGRIGADDDVRAAIASLGVLRARAAVLLLQAPHERERRMVAAILRHAGRAEAALRTIVDGPGMFPPPET